MNVAIIPARGGSKRIPRKNVRPFCGRPMMAWPIDALRASGSVEHIVVSTDDPEIAETAVALGALVPFMRPAELADDHTATLPVMAHAVRTLQAMGWPVETACCVYATSPLLEPADLSIARRTLDESGASYVFSCARFEFPIQRALRSTESGGVEPMFAGSIAMRSQDLPEAFHDAGQFYWGKASAFLEQLPIFALHSQAHLMPRHRVQDIDTEDDWIRAELMFRTFKERQS